MAVISIEEFKKLSSREVKIHPFIVGEEPITVRVKSTGIMNLISNGRIPNQLMSKVTELFGDTTAVAKDSNPGEITDEAKAAAMSKLQANEGSLGDMAALMKIFAENALVEPAYSEIGEYLTDEQLSDLFSAAMGGIIELEPFHDDEGTK